MRKIRLPSRRQLIGNAGLYHVARELSRRGWHVMPAVRNNERGADLYAVNEDQEIAIPIRCVALSTKATVPLGTDLDMVRSHWWVITINATSSWPGCYVMTLDEVRAGADRFDDGSYLLQEKAYALDCYFEAWHRLGDPSSQTAPALDDD